MDYNATAPPDPEVIARIRPYMEADFGNPSSLHREGQRARAAINGARAGLARILHCQENEILFTSGATEALNHVFLGFLQQPAGHLITTQIEHLAVLEPCRFLEKSGWSVTYLPVDGDGLVSPAAVRQAVRPDTRLISCMHANNETGTVQPVREIGEIARAAGIPFLTDAVQSFGKISVDLAAWNASFAVFSAHKIGGLKGTGLLYVRRDRDLTSLIRGGHQERGGRGGTENVAGIVAMAEAARLAEARRAGEAARLKTLRDTLEAGILKQLTGARVTAGGAERLPNTLHVVWEHLDSEKLLMGFDLAGIAISNGSACDSGSVEPSHVVAALGLPDSYRKGAVRFSLGRGTTAEEIDRALTETIRIVRHLQKERVHAGPVKHAGN